MGIGLGVISGSTINAIAIQKDNGQLKLPNWLIFRGLSSSKNNTLKATNSGRKPNQILNREVGLEEREITSLSKRWIEIASKEKDLEASGFLLSIDNQEFAQLEASKRLPAASAIKIPILLTVLSLIDSGELNWDESLELTNEVVGGGAGWMAYQPTGKIFPVHEVATEMIRISDNTATNLLIKRIGGINILNEHFKAFNLSSTEIKNLLPDLEGSNTTSAKDLALTIARIDSGELLSTRTRDLFREIMSTSMTNRLLPGGFLKGLGVNKKEVDYNLLIKGYRIYNKTGDIGIAYADAGLIQMPDNTRAVAGFLVKGPFNDPRSAELIRKMSAAMVPFLKSKRSSSSDD